MILVYLGGRFSLVISKLFPICMFARQNSETFWPIVLVSVKYSYNANIDNINLTVFASVEETGNAAQEKRKVVV